MFFFEITRLLGFVLAANSVFKLSYLRCAQGFECALVLFVEFSNILGEGGSGQHPFDPGAVETNWCGWTYCVKGRIAGVG